MRLLPFTLALGLGLGACKTANTVDETANPGDPATAEGEVQGGDPAPTGAGQGQPQRPAILAEKLQPVRGGNRALPPYKGDEPCKMALTGDSPVAKVCSAKGLRGAIEMMQTFVRRAKAEGIIFECADCHSDEDDYSKLTPQADAEFRKLLFLARPE